MKSIYKSITFIGGFMTMAAVATIGGCDSPSGHNQGSPHSDRPLAAKSAHASSPSDSSTDPAAPQASDQHTDDPQSPRVVTSSDTLPEHARRIVSLAPNVTEILFALDAGDRLVGVTRFADYPPAVEDIPSVGSMVQIDLEALLATKPDLVVGTISGGDPDLTRKLDGAGVPYGFVRMDDLDDTYGGIETLGRLVGKAQRASELADDMKADIQKVARRAGHDNPRQPPRVLMVYGRDPLVAAGPGTFGDELAELAGGHNVTGDADTSYPKLDIEKVISLDPERIIDATMAGADMDRQFWRQYPALQAVKDDQVYLIDDPVVLRPAPRLVEGLKMIRRAVAGRTTRPTDQ